jgi:hypothetical protein
MGAYRMITYEQIYNIVTKLIEQERAQFDGLVEAMKMKDRPRVYPLLIGDDAVKPFLPHRPKVVYGQKWVNDDSVVLAGARNKHADQSLPVYKYLEITPEIEDAIKAAKIELDENQND